MIVNHSPGDSVCLEGLCTCKREEQARMGFGSDVRKPTGPGTMAGPPPGGYKTTFVRMGDEVRPSIPQDGFQPAGQLETVQDPYEVRTVSVTGGEKGQKLARFDLVPVGPLTELVKHYGRGARKYEDRNWEKGYEWSKNYAAAQRHMTQFWGGEDIDPETGTPHVIAAAWHMFALAEFMEKHPDFDDRPRHD